MTTQAETTSYEINVMLYAGGRGDSQAMWAASKFLGVSRQVEWEGVKCTLLINDRASDSVSIRIFVDGAQVGTEYVYGISMDTEDNVDAAVDCMMEETSIEDVLWKFQGFPTVAS